MNMLWNALWGSEILLSLTLYYSKLLKTYYASPGIWILLVKRFFMQFADDAGKYWVITNLKQYHVSEMGILCI
jgi:hypothetical protein